MASRKYSLILFLMFLVAYPSPVLGKDNRGIAVTTTDQTHGAGWGNYHALIIGINAYKEWNPLQTAVKDAKDLREILIRRYGFSEKNVILRADSEATRDRIIHDLRNMATNLEDSDNLLIYYAGHGQLDDITGDGYWVPVEGKLDNSNTWISQYTIKSILSSEKVRGKNIVLVADSCYSGNMLRGGPKLLPLDDSGYLKKLEKAAARRSRQVITSGGVEPVADGGQDGHSLFAYYLLKALKENELEFIDIENLFHTQVWRYVTEIGDQRPNVGRLKTPMDDDGQFVLIDKESQAKKLALQERDKHEREQLTALIAEKERLEAERRRLEAEKQIIAERTILEAERRKIEEEKQKMEKASLEAERQKIEEEKQKMEKASLEAERRKIEEEKQKAEKASLEAERRKIEEEKQTAEKASLEAERHRVENEKAQKKQLAYIPQTPTPVEVKNRRTLALFPSILPTTPEIHVINGFKEAIADNKLFFPKLSYYHLERYLETKMIDKNTMPPDVIKNFWVKKSFWSNEEPNIELICKLGADLQVDYILLYHSTFPIPVYIEDLRVFLINVKTKKMFSESTKAVSHWHKGLGEFEETKRLTKKLFRNFGKNESQQ